MGTHRHRAALAAMATCVALAPAAGCSSDERATATTPRVTEPATTLPATTPPAATTTTAAGPEPGEQQRFDFPGGPDWLVADDSFVYVKMDNGTLYRLDPVTAEVLGETDVPGEKCQGLGAGFGSVWTCNGPEVVRIDPATDEIVATIPVVKQFNAGHMLAGFDRLWLLAGDGTQLVGIDPDTNTPDAPIVLDVAGSELALDEARIYVISRTTGTALAIDPSTGTVVGRAEGLDAPLAVATGNGLWLSSGTTSVRLDPATMTVTATVDRGSTQDGEIAVDGDDVWLRGVATDLVRLHAVTGEVLEEIDLDVESGGDVLVAFGALWATAYDDATIVRIQL